MIYLIILHLTSILDNNTFDWYIINKLHNDVLFYNADTLAWDVVDIFDWYIVNKLNNDAFVYIFDALDWVDMLYNDRLNFFF